MSEHLPASCCVRGTISSIQLDGLLLMPYRRGQFPNGAAGFILSCMH